MSVVPGPGHESERELEELLRRTMRGAGDGFDYAALVDGVHERAHRIRRRRTVGTLAAAAVLGPALIGGAITLPNIIGDPGAVAPPADTPDQAPVTVGVDDPPFQDGELLLPEGGEEFGAIPNAWEIPDPRPTDVDLLREWGAPDSLRNYPRIPALQQVMVCDPGNPGGDEPLSGQSWHYAPDEDAAGSLWESVDINVTGWADGEQAMQDLRDDTLMCARDPGAHGGAPGAEAPWPGMPGDPDVYLSEPFQLEEFDESVWVGVAAVRTGNYLVGVTVRHADRATADATAQEIATKTAANLEVLDPERAGD